MKSKASEYIKLNSAVCLYKLLPERKINRETHVKYRRHENIFYLNFQVYLSLDAGCYKKKSDEFSNIF
jgi:hypothetical protein